MHLRPRLLILAALAATAFVALVGCSSGDDDDDANAEASPPATFVLGGDNSARQDVHWHADFLLIINGEPFDFSQEKFVSHVGDEVHPYLHIHPERYTVAHVHKEQSTWREFFGTFGWELSDTFLDMGDDGGRVENDGTNTWKFFANGVRVDSIMFHNISDLERVLLVYGPETPEEALEKYWPEVTDQACIVSGLCADRVDPNEPPEECSGAGACS